MKVRIGVVLAVAIVPAAFCADPFALVQGDPLSCFQMSGAGSMTRVSVSSMPFATAIRVRTGAIPANANAWDIRPRCFTTLAARQDDVVVAAFWMRTVSAAAGKGLATFVVERGTAPYTKSVSFTAATQSDWRRVEVPFTMAETYAAGGYNLSFWTTFANQEIEIGGFTILDYGHGVPFHQLGLTAWPYDGHAPDAGWRAAATERIERLRKGDIVVAAKDESGNPILNAQVHVRMKRHAFGFGTAVAGDVIQRQNDDGQRYRDALKTLFNKVVTENALKWPAFESYGRAQADFMLPWFAANGITMVRGHNLIWPGARNLPRDVQSMLMTSPVDVAALRERTDSHIEQLMSYARGKVTEWDVLNEPYTNKDLHGALGEAEMAAWFQKARAADPSAKLYINDYSNVESGGYDLPHINGYYSIIQKILAAGGPIDGIGLQAHFNTNLTPPDRVIEVLDQFAALGKDLQITEFDIDLPDEQIQADYTRDFLTLCFSHPAMKGFLIWGFWEGAHWLPRGAMIRKDWTTKLNYDVWNDLLFHQWWTDVEGTTGADGVFRTRGFLGDYEVDVTVDGKTRTIPFTIQSNVEPATVMP